MSPTHLGALKTQGKSVKGPFQIRSVANLDPQPSPPSHLRHPSGFHGAVERGKGAAEVVRSGAVRSEVVRVEVRRVGVA